MDSIKWTEKSSSFRSLVDNPAVQKPALVQIGNKLIIVGEKIKGEFIMASPIKVSGDRFDAVDKEFVLSSKHPGIWKVLSKSTSRKEGFIHRLTTKDIESIHKQDVRNERSTPRTFICMKETEAFELIIRNHDPSVANGHRVERRVRYIEEDVEFQIQEIGEAEYTPSDGELTSQDYVKPPKNRPNSLLNLFLPSSGGREQLIRNRVVRAIYCTTINETHKRRFLLEVNEQPCDIRPIASEGSVELRYLHSTKNLYDYLLNYGNDTSLYVKLLRGDPPVKAVDYGGHMVLRTTLNGDRVPICRVDNLEITLVTPDLPVRVKLPVSENSWRSLSQIRAAELQCMQIPLALLSRHESEGYVTIEAEKNTTSYLQSNYNQDQRASTVQSTPESAKYYTETAIQTGVTKSSNEMRALQPRSSLADSRKAHKPASAYYSSSPKPVRAVAPSHPASDRLYQDNGKSGDSSNRRPDRTRRETGEKYTPSHRTTIREKTTSSSFTPTRSSSGSTYKTSTRA